MPWLVITEENLKHFQALLHCISHVITHTHFVTQRHNINASCIYLLPIAFLQKTSSIVHSPISAPIVYAVSDSPADFLHKILKRLWLGLAENVNIRVLLRQWVVHRVITTNPNCTVISLSCTLGMVQWFFYNRKNSALGAQQLLVHHQLGAQQLLVHYQSPNKMGIIRKQQYITVLHLILTHVDVV